jgi:uncharacterized protein involved in exopolysaccharide biosynthesis
MLHRREGTHGGSDQWGTRRPDLPIDGLSVKRSATMVRYSPPLRSGAWRISGLYTMEPTENTPLARNELSLRDLVLLLWDGRWIIIVTTAVCTLASVGAAFAFKRQFTATVVLSPATNSSASALGGIGSQLGGLASLAGLSLSGDQKKSESVAVLQSDALTEQYIVAQNLLPILYADKWDAQSATWKVTDKRKVPTVWKANEYFKKGIRNVATDLKTGIVTMTITWKDPKLAAQWANDLVKLTNEFLRDQAISETERNIAYLNDEASKTDVMGAKQAIYTLLQSEINRQMVARGNEAYALKVIDPAQPPEYASFPRRVIWLIGGFIGGILLSLIIVFARANWRRDSRQGR